MDKRRAFVLEPTRLDVSQAREFGELHYIFDAGERRASIWSEEFQAEVVENLKRANFDPEKDLLVIAGHLVPIVLSLTTLLRVHRAVSVLFYSAVDRCYIERKLDVNSSSASISDCKGCSR